MRCHASHLGTALPSGLSACKRNTELTYLLLTSDACEVQMTAVSVMSELLDLQSSASCILQAASRHEGSRLHSHVQSGSPTCTPCSLRWGSFCLAQFAGQMQPHPRSLHTAHPSDRQQGPALYCLTRPGMHGRGGQGCACVDQAPLQPGASGAIHEVTAHTHCLARAATASADQSPAIPQALCFQHV